MELDGGPEIVGQADGGARGRGRESNSRAASSGLPRTASSTPASEPDLLGVAAAGEELFGALQIPLVDEAVGGRGGEGLRVIASEGERALGGLPRGLPGLGRRREDPRGGSEHVGLH